MSKRKPSEGQRIYQPFSDPYPSNSLIHEDGVVKPEELNGVSRSDDIDKSSGLISGSPKSLIETG